MTLLVFRDLRRQAQQSQMEQFGDISNSLIEEFDSRIAAKKHLLLGVRGLFGRSFPVQRDEFHRYMSTIDMQRMFPATQAVVWIPRLYPDQVDEFLSELRQGVASPNSASQEPGIQPQSESGEYHVAAFIEPLQGNEAVLGFNLGSDPFLASSLRRARDSGDFVTTEQSSLSGLDISDNGFLMLLPIYGVDRPQTRGERRSKYLGSVAGVFRADRLINSSLIKRVDSVRVFDTGASSEALSSGPSSRISPSVFKSPVYQYGVSQLDDIRIHRSTSVGGRQWVFQLSMARERFNQPGDITAAWQIASLGALLSFISSLFVWSLVTSRDRALRKAQELTDELVTANKQLERSNKDLTQFAFVASHDLQTPVRNLEISITLLEDALGDRIDADVGESLGFMRDSTLRMKRLLEDLLLFARVDKESVTLHETDLTDLINRVGDRLSNYIDDNGARLSIGELPVVLVDQSQLERLIMNLITNAIKYRHPDRPIEIDVSARFDSNQWLISVTDNGMGIDKQHHDKVFESFQRLHRHDEIAGTGLGLGICKQIMAGHDGDIYIERSDETGTVFTFSLPYHEAMAKAA